MTRRFESHEDFAVWDLERQILEQHIRPFERHARTTFKALRCPVDPVAIYAILTGEKLEACEGVSRQRWRISQSKHRQGVSLGRGVRPV
jgi:hypothetical protein